MKLNDLKFLHIIAFFTSFRRQEGNQMLHVNYILEKLTKYLTITEPWCVLNNIYRDKDVLEYFNEIRKNNEVLDKIMNEYEKSLLTIKETTLNDIETYRDNINKQFEDFYEEKTI